MDNKEIMSSFSREEKSVIFESMLSTWEVISQDVSEKYLSVPHIIDMIFDASYILSFAPSREMDSWLYEKICKSYHLGFRDWAIKSWRKGFGQDVWASSQNYVDIFDYVTSGS